MTHTTAAQDRLERRTGEILRDLREAWGTTRTVEPVEYGPLPWYPDSVPDSVEEQLETFAGIASAVTFYTDAREETGLDVELTDLLYTGEVHYEYDDGNILVLPLAAFVGHRTAGQLRIERERNDHPGVCRGVGLFGPDVLPEDCRDRGEILALLPEQDDR